MNLGNVIVVFVVNFLWQILFIPGGRLLLSVALPVERQPNVMSVFVLVCSNGIP